MNDTPRSPKKPAGGSLQITLFQIALLPMALAVVCCTDIVVIGDSLGSTSTGYGSTTSVSTSGGFEEDPGADGGEVGTTSTNPPLGVWSMIVQYGPPGQVVGPTIPMQVELRADGTAFAWICAGAPDDGSFSQACVPVARFQCWIGTFAWNGKRWRVDFPVAHVDGVPQQGDITPDGNGNILISYINPTYSGALFKKVGEAMSGADACVP